MKCTLLKSAYLKNIRTIFDDPKLKWDYESLSKNPSITYSIVSMFPQLDWNYEYLSPGITYGDVASDLDKPWDYECLSKNPSITYRDVIDNPDKPWDYRYLSEGVTPPSPTR
jgi:hypothetical protein